MTEASNKRVIKEAIRKNEVKIEAKPAVKAVAKNEEVIKVANNLLGSDNVTEQTHREA